MAGSEVDIANMALGFLGVTRIMDMSESDECYVNYPACRDACLEDVDWTFATDRMTLTRAATGPAFGFANRFLIPSRVLRIIEVNENKHPWVKEKNYVLTDQESAQVRAVVRIEDVRQFSAEFVQALAFRLAATIAMPLTNSKKVADEHWAMYAALTRRASGNDGRQGTTQTLRSRTPRRSGR